jgi:CheY-like chemotaxis protein
MGFNYRILLVDDDANVREMSKLLLGSHGFDVQTAENGFEALVALRESLPDHHYFGLEDAEHVGF